MLVGPDTCSKNYKEERDKVYDLHQCHIKALRIRANRRENLRLVHTGSLPAAWASNLKGKKDVYLLNSDYKLVLQERSHSSKVFTFHLLDFQETMSKPVV